MRSHKKLIQKRISLKIRTSKSISMIKPTLKRRWNSTNIRKKLRKKNRYFYKLTSKTLNYKKLLSLFCPNLKQINLKLEKNYLLLFLLTLTPIHKLTLFKLFIPHNPLMTMCNPYPKENSKIYSHYHTNSKYKWPRPP